RYLFVVNNTIPDLEPGHIWRTTLFSASLMPVQTEIKLNGAISAVYDVLAGEKQSIRDGELRADCTTVPVKLYALLPQRIRRVSLAGPKNAGPGDAFAWSVRVLDDRGQPIRASVPVQVRLFNASIVFEERWGGVTSEGWDGQFVFPRNAQAGQ